MFGKNKLTLMTVLILTLAGSLAASVNDSATAATKRITDASVSVESSQSQVVQVGLPKGAQRTGSGADLAKYRAVMQDVARNNHGSVSHTEVLRWIGETARTAKDTLTIRLKQAGYTLAHVDAFDSEDGHVTPIAALRGSKSDSIIGLWVETPDNQTVLIWGRFHAIAAAKGKAESATQHTVVPLRKTAVVPTDCVAVRRARAYQAYKDYQYAKLMLPPSGLTD